MTYHRAKKLSEERTVVTSKKRSRNSQQGGEKQKPGLRGARSQLEPKQRTATLLGAAAWVSKRPLESELGSKPNSARTKLSASCFSSWKLSFFWKYGNHIISFGCLGGWSHFVTSIKKPLAWLQVCLANASFQGIKGSDESYIRAFSHPSSPVFLYPNRKDPWKSNLGSSALSDLVSFSIDPRQSSWGRHLDEPHV